MCKLELRIEIEPPKENGGTTEFNVQRKVPFLRFFHKWKNVATFNNYWDALLFKESYIPKDLLNNDNK